MYEAEISGCLRAVGDLARVEYRLPLHERGEITQVQRDLHAARMALADAASKMEAFAVVADFLTARISATAAQRAHVPPVPVEPLNGQGGVHGYTAPPFGVTGPLDGLPSFAPPLPTGPRSVDPTKQELERLIARWADYNNPSGLDFTRDFTLTPCVIEAFDRYGVGAAFRAYDIPNASCDLIECLEVGRFSPLANPDGDAGTPP